MPRLFVAIDLPAAVTGRLSSLCCGLPGARWVGPDQMHLTLRFIGEVDGRELKRIREALSEVRCESFAMQLNGIGFFPPRGKPRVVWAGTSRNDLLVQLRNRVESTLVRSGLEPEGRKFSPHITLARLRNTPREKVAAYLTYNSMFTTEEFPVNEFLLYSSVLNSKGAKHYIEDAYPLS